LIKKIPSLKSSPAVLSMLSSTVKLDEEKWNYTSLAEENGFGSAEFHSLRWLIKGKATVCTSRNECNKDHMTAAKCFWLAHHNDWSRWFVISSSPTYLLSHFQGWQQSIQLNLDVKNSFAGSYTKHHWGCSNTFSNPTHLRSQFCHMWSWY